MELAIKNQLKADKYYDTLDNRREQICTNKKNIGIHQYSHTRQSTQRCTQRSIINLIDIKHISIDENKQLSFDNFLKHIYMQIIKLLYNVIVIKLFYIF